MTSSAIKIPSISRIINPDNVYAQRMFLVGNGLGLWRPEPNSKDPDVTGEVFIGDVGLVYDGAFYRILNVTRPAGDPINKEAGLLDDFDPLKYSDTLRRNYPFEHRGGPVCSEGVSWTDVGAEIGAAVPGVTVGASFQASCKKAQGAMLLTHSARRETVAPNEKFKRYLQEHHASWCEMARNIEFDFKEEDILLVTGVTKAADWAVAAWSKKGKGFEASTKVEVPWLGDAGFHATKVQLNGMAASRSSQWPSQSPSPDQCLFLSFYRMKKRLWFMQRIEAGAGPHQLPPGDRNAGADDLATGAEDTSHDSMSHIRGDPVDDLLNYILEKTDAEIAIASDLDIGELLGEGDWPEKFADYLKEREPPLDVDERKVGSLSLIDAIQRTHRSEVQSAKQSLRERLPAPPPQEPPPEQDDRMDEDSEPPTDKGKSRRDPQRQTSIDDMDVDGEDAPKVLIAPAQGARDTFTTGGIVLKDGRTFEWPHQVLSGSIDGEAGSVLSTSISKDGSLFAAGYDDPQVRVWDIKSGSLVNQLRGHRDQVVSLAFSPRDDTKLVTGSADSKAIIWNLFDPGDPLELIGHDGNVWSVAFSPSGDVIATGSADSTVKLWDSDTGGLLKTIEDHPDAVQRVLFSPDGERLLASTGDMVLLWDTKNPENPHQLEEHSDMIWTVTFSPDSKRILTGSSDRTGRVWDAETGVELVTIREHAEEVTAVAFSPDTKRIVLGSEDGTLAICDSFAGNRYFHLKERPSPVTAAIYSPDGKFIVSGSASGLVRLWSAENGSFIAEFQGHKPQHSIKHIAFTPDNERFISSSEDGTSRVWKMSDIFRVCY